MNNKLQYCFWMLKNSLNPKKQGDIGLGVAIGWFASKGYTVSIPLTDSQPYDLVVEMNGKLCRVQVKTTYRQTRDGVFSVELRTKGGNKTGEVAKRFDAAQLDYLFVLTNDGTKFLIPTCGMANAMSINLGAQQQKHVV